MVLTCMRVHHFAKAFCILQPRKLPNQVPARIRGAITPSSPPNMARGNNNKARGKGYDWRQHIRPSNDPAIQNRVRQTIQQLLNDPNKPRALEFPPMEKSVVNTYRDYCRQMGVGWARGEQKRHWKMIRLGGSDPEIILWKKVWCFYFNNYCDVDLLAQAQNAQDDKKGCDSSKIDTKMKSGTGMVDIEADVSVNAEDCKEAEAIAHLVEATEQSSVDDLENGKESHDSLDAVGEEQVILDATSKSLDGKRMWTKVRDLLQEIKRNDQLLWEECRSLGVNNCSEKKLVPHLDKVQKFFDLHGNGPNQKIRGKKLRIGVGSNDEVQFLNAELSEMGVIEYAKPIKYSDASSIKRLIGLVDKANRSLGVNSDDMIECNLPTNIFNDNWRKKRRYFELGDRLSHDSVDPIYIERKNNIRKRLPAFNLGNEFCKHVFDNDVVILCGATGCGKTTQLPQVLMEEAAKLMHQQSSNPNYGDTRCFGTGRIICTQPRRISATSVTERVCFERNERIGDRVGYQIRFEHRATDSTELLYCTTGILLRFLTSNPKLEGISAVIIDEIHERSVHSDFVLLILKDLVIERKGTNEPLKIVLMSATIDASNLLHYFGADSGVRKSDDIFDQSPLSVHFMEIPGKTNYPITEYFLEDILDEIGPSFTLQGPLPESFHRGVCGNGPENMRNPWATTNAIREKYGEIGLSPNRYGNHVWENLATALQRPLRIDVKLISAVVEHIERCEWSENRSKRRKCGSGISENCRGDILGSILIFVPGWQEIKDVMKCLEKSLSSCRNQYEWAHNREWIVLPLHSMIPPKDQNRIFDPPSPNCRKVIIATNIAETSITVEDVVYVIDSGLIKGTTYNPHTNIASLETGQIARSNRQQRRGRAGRCLPGKFFMLYSQWECLHEMQDHEIPEMLRIPVEELCLQVKSLRLPGNSPVKDVLQKAIDPPKSMAVENAVGLLFELGAFRDVVEGGISNEEMTPLGWKLSQIPVHPSLGKMLLLGSLFDQYSGKSTHSHVLPSLISICSTLSFKSPFVLPFGKEKEADMAKKNYGKGLFSDHLLFVKVLDDYKDKMNYSSRGDLSQWLRKYYLSGKTLEMTIKIENDLKRYLGDLGVDCGQSFEKPAENAMSPLLSTILAASLNISFMPPMKRKIHSLSGGSTCSAHPSSLISSIETMGDDSTIWRKFKHVLNERNVDEDIQHLLLDRPDKIFILGWFERLKTSDIYLRDCTLFRDPLPLVLLLPNVKQRGVNYPNGSDIGSKFAHDSTIFEVIGGKSSSGGVEHDEKHSHQPRLLLKAKDKDISSSLMILRTKLDNLFGAVLSKTPSSQAEDDVRGVFGSLKSLFLESHSLYCSETYNDQTLVQNSVSDDILEIKHLCSFAECETLNPCLSKEVDVNGEFDDAQIEDSRPFFVNVQQHCDKGYNRNRGRGDRGRGGQGRRGGRNHQG